MIQSYSVRLGVEVSLLPDASRAGKFCLLINVLLGFFPKAFFFFPLLFSLDNYWCFRVKGNREHLGC